jgi:hypothetical protein
MIAVDYRNTLNVPVLDGKLDGSPLMSTYHVLMDDDMKPISMHNVSKDGVPNYSGYRIEVKYHRTSPWSNTIYHFYKLLIARQPCYGIEVWPSSYLQLSSDEFYFYVGWGENELKQGQLNYKYNANPFIEMHGRKLHFLHFTYGSAPDIIFPYHLEYGKDCFSANESSSLGGKGVIVNLTANGLLKKILIPTTYLPFTFHELFQALKKAGSYENFLAQNY